MKVYVVFEQQPWAPGEPVFRGVRLAESLDEACDKLGIRRPGDRDGSSVSVQCETVEVASLFQDARIKT